MKRVISIISMLLIVAIPQSGEAKSVKDNTLSKREIKEGWKLLFDGTSLSEHWYAAKSTDAPKWGVEDGAISVKKMVDGKLVSCGSIVTRESYSSFEFSVDFKITEGANSGIKYFVTKPKLLGLEYQILDDKVHPDAEKFTTIEGSRSLAGLYDMKKADPTKPFKGVGEWNNAVIKAYPDNRVEHYLNGVKVLEYLRGSKDFRDMVTNSKYKKFSTEKLQFGEAKEGYILLQDHGDQVYFRNIKIRDLSK